MQLELVKAGAGIDSVTHPQGRCGQVDVSHHRAHRMQVQWGSPMKQSKVAPAGVAARTQPDDATLAYHRHDNIRDNISEGQAVTLPLTKNPVDRGQLISCINRSNNE